MTVETDDNRVVYIGAGTTGPFDIDFPFIDDEDIVAIKTLIAEPFTETTLVLNVDYTLTGGGGEEGQLTTTDAVSAGYKLTIYRDPPVVQETDYGPHDGFPSQTHERALDKLTMICQRFKDILTRSFRLTDGDVSGMDTTMPTPIAGALLACNAGRTALEWVLDAGTVAFSAFGVSLVNVLDAAAGRTLLGAMASVDGVATGTLDIQGAVKMTGDVSPAQLVANTNDWAPAGIATASVIRFSTDARRSITGLTGGADGRIVNLANVGTFPAAFKIEDAGSTAANRFAFAVTLGGGQTMAIQYDATSSRWRPFGGLPEPIGTVKDFGMSTLPEGYLAVDQNVSRATYAALFNEIGTTWGTGDGATTFGLFVGAGSVLVAAGTGTHADSGGNAEVDTTTDLLTVPSNLAKWITGKQVVFTLASGTITGLTSGNTYYVIRIGNTTIKLASSLANAQNGTGIDLTAKAAPVWTITHTQAARTHGERLGEDGHAMSSTELLLHAHSLPNAFVSLVGGSDVAGGGGFIATSNITGNAGGNAAMNVTQPSAVVTRGVRYC